MKIIFVANTVNFHMTGLFDEFTSQNKDVTFIYLSTSKMDDERTHMGYKDLQRSYAMYSYEMNNEQLKELFSTTDIVLYGLSDDERVHNYIPLAKHLVVISEHIKRHNPIRNIISILNHFYRKKRFMLKMKGKSLLAMSYYASLEYSKHGFKDRCYRFGYFPELPALDNKDRDPFLLCYAGRLLKLKHVEHAVYALNYLKQYDSRYHLNIIGEGEAEEYLHHLIKKLNLDDSVKFFKFENHDSIIKRYSDSQIAFFSSDKQEGWGVVMNEMLSQGCVVFANIKAGSTRFLANNKNAFIYSNTKDMYKKLDVYVKMNKEEVNTMQQNARDTIKEQWNNRVAAQRLMELFNAVNEGKRLDKYQSGPVSLFKK